MAQIINFNFVRNFFLKGHERTIRAKKNITVSFLCRGLSIVISFLIIPLTLGYVGKVEYGIWMTISSIIQWFAFFDIGLGNGLRTKLAEALALNDKHTARVYISSVFAIITVIATFMFIGFFIGGYFISWNIVLNTSLVTNYELFKIVITVFFFFCMGFVLSLVSSILQAMQKYALNDIIGLIAQLLGLVAIFILVKTTKSSLFYLCLIYGCKSAIVLFFASIILFLGSLKKYRPTIKYINIKKALPLISLGVKFFIAQLFYLIVTQTAVILVVQFFGPEEVTVYNLAVRYMSMTAMGYLMILTPFLSAFTEAYTKGEFEWIKVTIRRINWIWAAASTITIFMVFFYSLFFKLWVGNAITVPLSLIVALAISSIIGMLNGTYGLFLNGIGKIHIQLYILGFQALLYFPLSYFFYKLGFGLASIVVVQIIFNFFGTYIIYSQYKKIVNQKAKGIWIK
ncbi:MAG: oligosaccharide flippase family protein [Bacteroidetes bacterium]|nr:oligosaccharide flippase family protein [Bacteroidota bacterium]